MVKFSEKELKQQIRAAIQPICDVTQDVDQLILSVMSNNSTSLAEEEQLTEDVGQVALWKGSADENVIGVLINESSIQLYKKTRFGFVPRGLPVDANEWSFTKKIESFHYIEKGGINLLVLETDL